MCILFPPVASIARLQLCLLGALAVCCAVAAAVTGWLHRVVGQSCFPIVATIALQYGQNERKDRLLLLPIIRTDVYPPPHLAPQEDFKSFFFGRKRQLYTRGISPWLSWLGKWSRWALDVKRRARERTTTARSSGTIGKRGKKSQLLNASMFTDGGGIREYVRM